MKCTLVDGHRTQKKYILIFPESRQISDFEIFIDPKKKGDKNNGL